MKKKQRRNDLIGFMHELISHLHAEGRYGTAHVYRSTLRRIIEFEGGRKEIPLTNVTTCWLNAFQNYLLSRGAGSNTISTYIRMLRATYNRAVQKGMAPYIPFLFNKVHTGVERGKSRALSVEMMRRIMKPDRELPPELEDARSLFVLLFMLRGLCFVDLFFLRRNDLQGSTLRYRRHKTGRPLRVEAGPEAMKIIGKYATKATENQRLFSLTSSAEGMEYRLYQCALRTFNKRLKQLSLHLELGVNLSTYCARHSWATIANFCHYDKALISNAMGHSSLKVTETYFQDFRDEEIDRMNQGVISHVIHGSWGITA
ncbi:tyrosine-type recombinase/integrase [Bacteroides pyogenes]|uniref:tyrosine-type recombinase/integrase n=1 Tax=Bacteroides pyogenes TaxID=310300 RepID=UPI000E19C746|nr:site-specific integrase [Bacteroides pyogenes]SUV34855.1 integrase [Bacteroides pyogenes]